MLNNNSLTPHSNPASGRAVLIILDGFGTGKDSPCNAIANARMPFYKDLYQHCPHSLLLTHGNAVGLPDGVMGNSEVGHTTMGAGRVLYQDLVRINQSITTRAFFKNQVLKTALESGAQKGGTVHLMGLLSDGGVHSHQSHLLALLDLCTELQIPKVSVHAFLDGRDTPPNSGRNYLAKLLTHEAFQSGRAKVATLSGRYFAMDRDKRWERIEEAFQALIGNATPFETQDPLLALEKLYEKEPKGDEFIPPTLLVKEGAIKTGDSLVFFNFRADRARELSEKFKASTSPKLSNFSTFTEYDVKLSLPVAFPPTALHHLFGELLEEKGLKQFRIAETEKYAHVTFFFNGGREAPYRGEDRVLVPSPREVPTYDLKPEMSAPEIAREAALRISQAQYDFVLMNFANSDMVGHTGNYGAALKAMETLDQCLEKVVKSALSADYHVLITADHGNAEEMCDDEGHPHTQHTLNPVPFLWVDPKNTRSGKEQKLHDGSLADLYPTLCKLMGLSLPKEITGKSLI